MELAIFSFRCGCVGLTALTKSLIVEEVDAMMPYIERLSLDIGIKPNIIYARVIPGTSEVRTLNSRVLCGECYKKYKYKYIGKHRPKPDVIILQFLLNLFLK